MQFADGEILYERLIIKSMVKNITDFLNEEVLQQRESGLNYKTEISIHGVSFL